MMIKKLIFFSFFYCVEVIGSYLIHNPFPPILFTIYIIQKMPVRPIHSVFRNESRMTTMLKAMDAGDRATMEEITCSRTYNHALWRLLRGKDVTTTELKDGVVYKIVSKEEQVVLKVFPKNDGFPFHEICGNLLAVKILDTCPFFVRTLDIGQDRYNNYILVMEYLPGDISTLDLKNPVYLYNLFYQVAYACAEMEKHGHLQHYDLRSDNIMVRMLPEPRDLFKNGIMSPFVIKVADFGQCEFDFDMERPINPDIPRSLSDETEWGIYPSNYTGYDMQYFLMTLPWILDELNEYYIYQMIVSFLGPTTMTTKQYRPIMITPRTPTDILSFLKRKVKSSLDLTD